MTMSTCGLTSTTRRRPRASGRVGRQLARALVASLACALLLAGCASGSTGTQAKPTTTPAPTATVPPLPTIIPNGRVRAACGGASGAALSIGRVQVGQFDAWQELPSTLQLAPQPTSVAKVIGNLALKTVTVDLGLAGATDAAPGYVCAVTVAIRAYAPLPMPIPNVIRTCSDHAYLDPGGPDYGGDCGVITGPPASAAVVFSASAVGTVVTVPVANAADASKPARFPTSDGRAPHIWITFTVPASGSYTFVAGLWQDQAGPTIRAEVTERFNLDAVHEWSGQACTSQSMQAQLPPPTSPPTPLLCPGAPPPLT